MCTRSELARNTQGSGCLHTPDTAALVASRASSSTLRSELIATAETHSTGTSPPTHRDEQNRTTWRQGKSPTRQLLD